MGTGTKVSRARKDTAIGNKLYESIMDGITSGVWVADKNNVIYYANKAMEMIAGVTQQKLIGSKVFPSSAELATKEFRPYYDEAQETLRPVYYSGVSIRTSAGKQTYQSGWLIPIIESGKYDGMICTVEDITNDKQTRKALKESEAKYKQLVESANSIILRMDGKGVITFINPFAQKYFGYGEQEIVGKNIVGTIMRERESTRRDMGAMLQNIGTNSEQYASAEIETIRKNGETAWISWSNKALVDDSGTMTEVLCIGNDVTVQKQHEDLLEKWNSDLEERVKLGTARLRIANEELQ